MHPTFILYSKLEVQGSLKEQDCECDSYCDRCSVELSLHVTCTENFEGALNVKSDDLLVKNMADGTGRGEFGRPLSELIFFYTDPIWSSTELLLFISGDVLICKLGKGQSLKLTCLAIKVSPV